MSCTRDCGRARARARGVPRKKEIGKVRILSIRPRADIFDACGAGSRRAALAHARGEGVSPRGVRVRVRVVRVGFGRCPRGAPVRTTTAAAAAAALRRVEPRVDLREAAVAVDAAVIAAAAAAVGGGARGGAQERDDGRVRVSVRRGEQVLLLVLLLGAALARGAEEGRLRGGGGYGGGRGGGGVHGRGGAEGRARERAALVRELLRARARVGALEEAALVAELERR